MRHQSDWAPGGRDVHEIPFSKMTGAGNDFIIVDNRTGLLSSFGLSEFARRVCTRRLSLGGDELMVIEPSSAGGDFSMRTFNPDGAEVRMCGNASRCVARYAFTHAIAGPQMTIDTLGGPVQAWVDGEAVRVMLQTTEPVRTYHALMALGQAHQVHTVEISGTPHAVLIREDIAGMPAESLHALGAAICHHSDFPEGINVDFIEVIDRRTVRQRTFERGVEGETLACGTGAAASAAVCAMLGMVDDPISFRVLGGELGISYRRKGDAFDELYLTGEARFVAEGMLCPEAWTWSEPD